MFGLLIGLAACGGSDSSANSESRSTRDQTSTSARAQASAGEQAIAAYNAMWQDMAAAAETGDYQSPRLAQHAAGNALSQLVRGLYANKQHGIVAKGDPVTNPKATRGGSNDAATTVGITDCFDDSQWLNYVASTGALQNDTPGGKHATTATVSKSEGVWKVTELAVGAVGTC